MKNINKIIPIILLVLISSSCKKYLDEKSNTGLKVPTTISDLQGLLDDAVVMNQTITPSGGESSADDYFLLDATYSSGLNERQQNVYRWSPYPNYPFPNDWSLNYVPIYNANYCLEQLTSNAINSTNLTDWNNVKGSALFLRAYYFSQLIWTFSKAYDENSAANDLGIALRLTSDFNTVSVRSSVKDSYDRIINDAKEAVGYLPDLPAHTFRPSKAAAYGLLARVYLTTRNYDSAFKYSNLCMSIKNSLLNYRTDINSGASFPFLRFNSETIFYTEMNLTVANVNMIYAKVDTALYVSYAANDIRKKAFFKANSGYQQFKGSYVGKSTLFTGIATDEMFLIRAETYARRGDKTSALNDLNSLLSKRYDATFVPITATDANDALAKILAERRKELIFRGLRFIDIKRLNKEGTNIVLKRIINGQTYTLPPNDSRYALPLPLDVINQSGMSQNPY